MNILIVSYDLSNPGQNYESFLKELKSGQDWARLGGSSYLVNTNLTPVQLRDNLANHLDSNDQLYVGVAPAPAAWIGMPDDVSSWIREKS